MELVLIRGLPGSGKTTMGACLRWLATNTTKPTTYFERDGAYRFDLAELPKAHAWCLDHAMGGISLGAPGVRDSQLRSRGAGRMQPCWMPLKLGCRCVIQSA